MSRVGIFYGSSKGATRKVAGKLARALGKQRVDLLDVRKCKAKRLLDYELIILGSPTYEKGKLQEDWYGFLDKMKKLNLDGCCAAVFALGDQKKYNKSFADALKPLHRAARKRGATMIGAWPARGYKFKRSAGLKKDTFLGLVIDDDRQSALTNDRIRAWAEQLLEEFSAPASK
jgi:flavodoxin long chain